MTPCSVVADRRRQAGSGADQHRLHQASTGQWDCPSQADCRYPRRQTEVEEDAQRPEFTTCSFTAETIVADGEGKGTTQKVCTSPNCPMHLPKRQVAKADAAFKAQQERQRREEAMAQATELRVLKAIGDAVPVRLMKRDLLFILEQLVARLDGRRPAIMDR
jgi:ParB family transcriptional regulator, chromosome partitioning protein